MGIYERLGVRRVLNGYASLTRLGGSLMPPPVLQAMLEAAESFCDLHDLQRRAGDRIAELTRNEAAYICNGASSGLFLATLACVTRGDMRQIAHLPTLVGPRDEVIVFCSQRNPYDLAVRQAGVRVVQIGNVSQTFAWELEAVLGERTAALLYVAGAPFARGALPLPEVIALCHAAGVPVIIDTADQVPPPESLWRYTTEMGADLAVVSGGKGLRGPQSSGLILGRRDLIEAVRELGAPHQRIGRPMKVGKEEMCGLVAAVEWYLSLDQEALTARYERQVAAVVGALADLPGVTARRAFPNVVGLPIPRVHVEIDPAASGTTRDAVLAALWEGEPAIALAPEGAAGLYVSPLALTEEESAVVARRLVEELTPATGQRAAGAPPVTRPAHA
jgi:D-glucosaminate-6-phosphate ammonia-lyase